MTGGDKPLKKVRTAKMFVSIMYMYAYKSQKHLHFQNTFELVDFVSTLKHGHAFFYASQQVSGNIKNLLELGWPLELQLVFIKTIVLFEQLNKPKRRTAEKCKLNLIATLCRKRTKYTFPSLSALLFEESSHLNCSHHYRINYEFDRVRDYF